MSTQAHCKYLKGRAWTSTTRAVDLLDLAKDLSCRCPKCAKKSRSDMAGESRVGRAQDGPSPTSVERWLVIAWGGKMWIYGFRSAAHFVQARSELHASHAYNQLATWHLTSMP